MTFITLVVGRYAASPAASFAGHQILMQMWNIPINRWSWRKRRNGDALARQPDDADGSKTGEQSDQEMFPAHGHGLNRRQREESGARAEQLRRRLWQTSGFRPRAPVGDRWGTVPNHAASNACSRLFSQARCFARAHGASIARP